LGHQEEIQLLHRKIILARKKAMDLIVPFLDFTLFSALIKTQEAIICPYFPNKGTEHQSRQNVSVTDVLF